VSGLHAVLFDMDGTLLDSEKLWDVALADLAEELGGSLSGAARERMVGNALGRSVAIMHEELGIDADPEASGAFLLGRAEELFRTALEWRPGAQDLLWAVFDEGLPSALVTSTHRHLTELALDFIGRDFFVASVCGDEVSAPKPHAEPYARGAELLGADPARCVAVEDSPTGVTSAQAAGCAVLAVPSQVPLEPGPRRVVRGSLLDVTVNDLYDLVAD
jgi:HAD superfamily hydrolase (TIGR01509 family)